MSSPPDPMESLFSDPPTPVAARPAPAPPVPKPPAARQVSTTTSAASVAPTSVPDAGKSPVIPLPKVAVTSISKSLTIPAVKLPAEPPKGDTAPALKSATAPSLKSPAVPPPATTTSIESGAPVSTSLSVQSKEKEKAANPKGKTTAASKPEPKARLTQTGFGASPTIPPPITKANLAGLSFKKRSTTASDAPTASQAPHEPAKVIAPPRIPRKRKPSAEALSVTIAPPVPSFADEIVHSPVSGFEPLPDFGMPMDQDTEMNVDEPAPER